jgi:hypothetical protein
MHLGNFLRWEATSEAGSRAANWFRKHNNSNNNNYVNNKFWEEVIAYFPLTDTDCIENQKSRREDTERLTHKLKN